MTHHLKSTKNSNSYYGFADSSSSSTSSPSSDHPEPVTVSNGGISFVINSNSSFTGNPNQSQNNHQLGSISSVSSSSGISSGSNTITKSSGFNGNTFTRSRPKERKPIPVYFAGDGGGGGEQQEEATAAEGKKGSSQTGKGLIIPTLTLSPDTPPSAAAHASSSPFNKDSSNNSVIVSSPSPADFFFDNSNSSGGTIVQNCSDSENKTLLNNGSSSSGGSSGSKRSKSNNVNVSLLSDSSINFQPDACSTFILAEGEEFPEETSGSSENSSNNGSRHHHQRRHKTSFQRQLGATASSAAERSGDGGIDDGKIMKVEELTGASATASASGIVTVEENSGSPNGSSSGIQSNFSGEEENFECLGEGGDQSFTLDTGSADTSLQFTRDGTDLDLTSSGIGGGSSTPLSRNSWTRTSLRKSPQNSSSNGEAMGYRRWGSFRNAPGTKRAPPVVTSSNALANQLYRSSSFHSSGRSSAGDAEEMYSDGSLEDEVIDLTHKVHHLEEKMNVLAENQTDADDRYTREKEKNAELSTKVFMLEEQLRETELRGDEKLREEQRRFKEFQSRWDREKQLQSENYEIRLQSMEKDLSQAKGESTRMKNQLERERSEKDQYGDKNLEMERELGFLREENRLLQDQGRKDREAMALESAGAQQALLELKREVESVRQFQIKNSPSSLRRQDESIEDELELSHELKSRLKEYEEEVKKLKKHNEQLQDSNDELNAQLLNRGLEEGRTLLTTINSVPAGNSLAAEFEAMSQDQNALGLYAQSETDLAKVKKALKEQVDVNEQLRAYIDGILLIIVENNPQLLEVKNHSSSRNDKCQPMTNGIGK